VKESEIDWWRITTPSPVPEIPEPPILNVERKNVDLCLKSEKSKGLWSHLSSPEKQKVCELIGYVEGGIRPEKPKLYIGIFFKYFVILYIFIFYNVLEHKINFTLVNLSISLINRGKEVLVLTLTQLLLSLETRPAAKAFKVCNLFGYM
jgi:vacuolar protein sorting-associated protein 13A/C